MESFKRAKETLSRFTARPWSLPLLVFAGVTLAVAIAGRDMAFVREDVMWLNILRDYSPIDYLSVLLRGIQSEFISDFPWVDWPYRPLEHLLIPAQLALFGGNAPVLIWLKSLALGANAVLIYLLAMALTGKRFIALASAFCVSLSIPLLIDSWWFHHMAIWVELLILFGLLSYLRYNQTERRGWLVGLWLTSFIAPWFHESGLSLPVTVLLATVVERRKDWKLLVPFPLFIANGLFPAFLPNLLIAQRIVFTSIFHSFTAGTAAQQGLFTAIQPDVPFLTLGSLSPVLILVAFISLLVALSVKRSTVSGVEIGLVLSFLAALWLAFPPPPYPVRLNLLTALSVLLPVFLALSSFRLNKLVPVWFIVSYLPFLRLTHLSVNLIPAIVPWTIMVCFWIYVLVDRVRSKPGLFGSLRLKRLALSSLILFISVGIVAQASNIFITRETWGKIASNTRAMGEYAAGNLPPGSILLGERDSLFEVIAAGYYAGDTVTGRIVLTPDNVPVNYPTTPIRTDELKLFLESNHRAGRGVYLLVQPDVPETLYRYVGDNFDHFQLEATFAVPAQFPIIDPVMLLLPRQYQPYSGFNFLHLAPGDDTLFCRQFHTEYNLYKYSPGSSD